MDNLAEIEKDEAEIIDEEKLAEIEKEMLKVRDLIDSDTTFNYEGALIEMQKEWIDLVNFEGSVLEFCTEKTKKCVLEKIQGIVSIHKIRYFLKDTKNLKSYSKFS